MIQPAIIRTVLFDLDGTLVNTAPDLVNALNAVLERHDHPAVPLADVSPLISTGAAGMLGFALGDIPEQRKQVLVNELVEHYHSHIADNSQLYPQMENVLQQLEQRGIQWGIVTNKVTRLTESLLDKLNLANRAACIISGDTTPHSKPHPAPLLEACRIIGTPPKNCVYVGDAKSDIEAAQRAMMPSLAAAYGFIGTDDQPHNWGANVVVDNANQILDWVIQHV
ncbi:MAG: HAD-IA family hydrolase [Methylococcales bacterium]